MGKFIDLTNKTFGKLTVIKRHCTQNGDVIWECQCECGNKSYPSTYNLRKKNGTKSCGCSQHKIGKNSYKWKGYEDISGRYWYAIKSNAKQRNINFDITIEYIWMLYIQQNKKCAITGLPISVIHSGNNRNRHYSSASLDRIDSSKGYVEGNVQWVLKKINQIKMDLNANDFICLCNLVSKENIIDDITLEAFKSTTDWANIRRKHELPI